MRAIVPSATIFPKLAVFYLAFWFLAVPAKLFKNLIKFLRAAEHFFSLTLMLKTLFRPWKNERRPGYVAYAVGIAATVRFFLIIFDLFLLSAIFLLGIAGIIVFAAVPILSIFLIFGAAWI